MIGAALSIFASMEPVERLIAVVLALAMAVGSAALMYLVPGQTDDPLVAQREAAGYEMYCAKEGMAFVLGTGAKSPYCKDWQWRCFRSEGCGLRSDARAQALEGTSAAPRSRASSRSSPNARPPLGCGRI